MIDCGQTFVKDVPEDEAQRNVWHSNFMEKMRFKQDAPGSPSARASIFVSDATYAAHHVSRIIHSSCVTAMAK